MDGIAAVQARIQQIESQFGLPSEAGGVLGASPPGATATDPTGAGTDPTQSTSSFAAALSQAQGTPAAGAAGNASVPTSSGKLNRAGVDPVQWARDFLTEL